VAQWWTADAKLIDFRSSAFVSRYIAPAMQVGVGHMFTLALSEGDLRLRSEGLSMCLYSVAVGVGHKS
jgi:hypothetical protein